jgi:hypothetical protein
VGERRKTIRLSWTRAERRGKDFEDREIEALVLGPFGIHRRHGEHFDIRGWQVTHIPTGCQVVRTVTRRESIDAARYLRNLRGIDWTITESSYFGKRRLSKTAWNRLKRLQQRLLDPPLRRPAVSR